MRRAPGVAALACMLGACGVQPASDRFHTWRSAHRMEVEAYDAFLRKEGVAGTVPLRDLLRSGRRWKHCGADEFIVPPRDA